MTLKIIALTAAITLASATSAFAATLDFGFSFDTGANEVTGTIFGLEDDTNGNVPASFEILGSPEGPLSGFVDFGSSYFDISDGLIVGWYLSAFSPDDGFWISGGSGYGGGVQFTDETFSTASGYFADGDVLAGGILSFGPGVARDGSAASGPPVPAVPLPAGGLLLLSGLAGVAALKRRKKLTA